MRRFVQEVNIIFLAKVFTEAGTYEFVLAGENGCDSTIVINIEVVPLQYGAFDVEICSGESYNYNGHYADGNRCF